MRILLPKTLIVETDELRRLPLFFLAGPILGGNDWHVRMSELLTEKVGDCIIVNPSRYTEDHPHYKYRLEGVEDTFPHQTAWERHYLEQAALQWPKGCIIFWLAAESTEHPRTDGQPYAMDTRGEIGEWRGRMMHSNLLHVAMGADPNFPGLRTIKRNNEEALHGRLPVFETMEEVADMAIALSDALSTDTEDTDIPPLLRRLAQDN